MTKNNKIQKFVTFLLTVLLFMSSLPVMSVFAEGETENGDPDNISENTENNESESNEQLRNAGLLKTTENNDFVEVAIALPDDVPQDLIKPVAYAFYVKDESDEYALNNEAVAGFVYSYQYNDEYGFDFVLDRSVFSAVLSGEKEAKIAVRFSDQSEKEFVVYNCIDSDHVDNGYDRGSYELRLWAVAKTTISDVRVIFNGGEIGMFAQKYPDHEDWLIDINEENQRLVDMFYSMLYGNYDQTSFSVKYKIGNEEYTLDKAQFIKGNIDEHHGYYYVYHLSDDENGIIVIGSEESVEIADFDGASYIVDDQTAYDFVYNQEKSDAYTRVYELDETIDPDLIVEGERLSLSFKRQDQNWERTYFVYRMGNNDDMYLGRQLYFTDENNNPDCRLVFICKHMNWDDSKDHSIVELVSDYDYNCYYDEQQNQCHWEFYVDPLELYSESGITLDVVFKNKGKYQDVEFEQQLDKSTYTVPTIKDQQNETITLTLKGNDTNPEAYFHVYGKESGTVKETQRHEFRVQCRTKDILEHTFVTNVLPAPGITVYGNWFDGIRNLQNGIFKNLTYYLDISGDCQEFMDLIRNNNVPADYEDRFYSIRLKDGVSLVSKEYQLFKQDNDELPSIIYVLSDDNIQETFVVRLRANNSVVTDGIYIDGLFYNKFVITRGEQDYTVYISDRSYQNPENVLNYLNYKYPLIVVKAIFDHNEDGELFYDEGIFYKLVNVYDLNIYYPGEGIEVKDGISLSDLNRITEADDAFIIKNQSGEGGISYKRATEMVYNTRRMPAAYIDQSGQLVYIQQKFFDYNDFLAYNGNDVAYYIGVENTGNGYTMTQQYKTRKVISIVNFDSYGVTFDIKGDGRIEEISGSGADRLEAAVETLRGYSNSVIKLSGDFSLDRDVVLQSFILAGTEADKCLAIDLNGHTFDMKQYQFELPYEGQLRFINSDKDHRGKIIGTGEFLFRNYGNLMFSDEIDIVNNNGTAIIQINDADMLQVGMDVRIEAKTGLRWDERNTKLFLDKENVAIEMKGEIKASDYCIYVDLPTDNPDTNYNLMLSRWTRENTDYGNLISDDIGIYVNGDIILTTNFYSVKAKKPFVVNGGKYNLNDINIEATDGDAFLVRSDDPKATPVRVSYILEGPEPANMIKASGAIIADTASSNSKIEKASLTSAMGAKYYFDYSTLFSNVPSNVIDINGGYYIDKSFVNYLPAGMVVPEGGQYDPDKFNIQQVTYQGNTYYRLIKPNTDKNVSTLQELIDALKSKYVTFIHLTNNISGNGELIDFYIDDGKMIDLDKHVLKDVCLDARVTEIDRNNNNTGEFKIRGGTIENSKGDALILEGAKLRLWDDTEIISDNNNGVVLKNGDITFENGKNVICGKHAIYVDIDKSKQGYYGSVGCRNGRLIGYSGEAIYVNSTYEANELLHIMVEDCVVGVQQSRYSKALPKDVNAITFMDKGTIDLDHDTVAAGNYVLYNADKAEGCSFHINGGVFTGRNGIRAAKDTHVNIAYDTQITATDNAIELYDQSHIELMSGYIKGGNEDIHYLDDEGPRPMQDVRGGNFSKFVTKRSISTDTGRNKYHYLCLQLEPLDTAYPYAVVLQYTDVRVFQNISLSIKRETTIDQDLLEGAITEAEREVLEAEAAASEADGANTRTVDIVFTIKPETSAENINKFPHNLGDPEFTEYYDVHINKNVGQNKQRVDEVSRYQLITMSLADIMGDDGEPISLDKDKLNIYHRHGNGVAKQMKKVSEEDGRKLKEECYFISGEEGHYYVNIVTKRFSTFGFGQSKEIVNPSALKADVSNDLSQAMSIYQNAYVQGDAPAIGETVAVGDKTLTVKSDLKIAYEGTDKTTYYSQSAYDSDKDEYTAAVFPSEPGTYKAVWTINDEYGQASGSAEKSFTIVGPAPQESDLSEQQKPQAVTGLKYNGQQQTLISAPSAAVQGYENIEYSIDGGQNWSKDLPKGKDAKTYSVLSRYSDQDGVYTDLVLTAISVEIGKADAPEDKDQLPDGYAPKANNELEYDGTAKRLITTPNVILDGYSKILYSIDDGLSWSETVPSGTKAGKFTVRSKYVGDNNHESFEISPIEVTIAKQQQDQSAIAENQKPTAKTSDMAYDGSSKKLLNEPTAKLPDGYQGIEYSLDGKNWDTAIPEASTAGEYEVQVRYVGDENHEDLLLDPITATISKAAAPSKDSIQDEQKPKAADGLKYSGDAQDLLTAPTSSTLPAGYDKIMYSLDGKNWSEDVPKASDAGNYSVAVKYVDSSNNHEDLIGDNVNVSIAAADAPSEEEISQLPEENKASSAGDLQYNKEPQQLAKAPRSLPEGYTGVQYSTDGGKNWRSAIPSAEIPGDYNVMVKYLGDNNHSDFIGETINVRISEVYYSLRDGASWRVGDDAGLVLTFKSNYKDEDTFTDFVSLSIDGKKTDEYSASAGSLIITLKPSYLGKLTLGKHSVEVEFKDGTAETYFFIEERRTPDGSGSSSSASLSSSSKDYYPIPKTGIE